MTRFIPPGPLGFGSAPIGNLFAALTDEEAESAIQAAWDAGIRFFDTAPMYGLGLAERRLGRALRQKPRDGFVLSTKVGRLLDPDPGAPSTQYNFMEVPKFRVRFDYSAAAARRSVEDSLQRTGLASIDIVLIHDVGEDTHGPAWKDRFAEAMAGAAPALTQMRDEGLIRAWGLGVNMVAPCALTLQAADPDLFLLAGRYTLLDHTAAAPFLDACRDRDVSLIIGGPYNSGLLAGGTTFDYAPASADMLDRRARIAAVCDSHGVSIKAAALQFCAAPDEVATVVPGGRSIAEVAENARLMAQILPAAFWQDLKDQGLIAPQAAIPKV